MGREEELLRGLIDGASVDAEPQSRSEAYLKAMVDGDDVSELGEPQSRIEELYLELADVIEGGGGGGGSHTLITPLSVEENGTYTAPEGTAYSPVTVNVPTGGGSAELKAFVLRPDAELVQRWDYDKLIVADEGVELPAYSTSQITLKASTTLLSSEALNFEDYHFIVFQRMLTIPVYSESTIIKGREEFHEGVYCYEIVNTPRGTIQSRNGEVTTDDVTTIPSSYNGSRLVYYNSNLSLTAKEVSTYGASMTSGTVTLSGSRLTVKSPSMRIGGNTTYFPSAAWDVLTDIRHQYIVELWRSRVDASEPGWPISNGLHHIANCYKNGGKLT